jgi:spore maturation protein CgeB
MDEDDRARYECDVSFIGTWSPKKQRLLEEVRRRMPWVRLRVWGAQWEQARATLGASIEGRGVYGREYAKAIVGSSINLAILSEAREGASSGDLITSRTFHIPATGAFMLHERTDEFLEYFTEGRECACFATIEEMIERIGCYLDNDEERRRMAAAGLQRSIESNYAVDGRAVKIVEKVFDIRLARQQSLTV